MNDILIFLISLINTVVVWYFIVKYFNKKGSNKLVSNLSGFATGLFAFVITLLLFIPLDEKDIDKNISQPEQKLKVLSVSDYSYTLKGKQAVSISIGTKDIENIDLTINRNIIKKNLHIDTRTNIDNKKLISATATWNNKKYWDNKNSFIVLKILDIDYSKKIAQLDLTLSLYEAKENPSNFKISLTINIEDKLFNNLTKK